MQPYANLSRLITLAHAPGGRKNPRLPWAALIGTDEGAGDGEERGEVGGLICLTGCRKGLIPRLVRAGRYHEAQDVAQRLERAFGEGNLFIEIQDDWTPGSRNLARMLALVAFHSGLPIVATNNVHYATEGDAIAHEVLRAVATGTTVAEVHPERPLNAERYLKSAREIRNLYRWREDACDNTLRIAERCTATDVLPIGEHAADLTPGWNDGDAGAELRRRTLAGARERYGSERGRIKQEGELIRSRLDHELDVITRLGFAPYVLHTQEIVAWAWGEPSGRAGQDAQC